MYLIGSFADFRTLQLAQRSWILRASCFPPLAIGMM
jgi:hypothetical protein